MEVPWAEVESNLARDPLAVCGPAPARLYPTIGVISILLDSLQLQNDYSASFRALRLVKQNLCMAG